MVGLLALQGDYRAHAKIFAGIGVATREVRRVHQLDGLSGLVIPGGESTTLLNLMRDEPWFEALRDYHSAGGALFGTCAGAILLAREVRNPQQSSLGLIDTAIERNAYGRQVDSFEASLRVQDFDRSLTALFIRAPRFCDIGEGVEVLARHGDEPVLLKQGRVLAGTFHSELTADPRIHEIFAAMAKVTSEPARQAIAG